ITKWSHRVTVARDIPRLVAQAIRIATSAPTGPVLLDMPIDVLTTSLDEGSVRIPQTARISGRAGPDAPSVAAALDLLRGAERPILLVGSGAWQSGCAA